MEIPFSSTKPHAKKQKAEIINQRYKFFNMQTKKKMVWKHRDTPSDSYLMICFNNLNSGFHTRNSKHSHWETKSILPE